MSDSKALPETQDFIVRLVERIDKTAYPHRRRTVYGAYNKTTNVMEGSVERLSHAISGVKGLQQELDDARAGLVSESEDDPLAAIKELEEDV